MKSWNKRVLIISLTLIVSLIASLCFIYINSFAPPNRNRVIVEISRGIGLREIASKLEESGVVPSDKIFILFVVLKGKQNKLQAGEYEFDPGDSMSGVLEKLVRGDVIVRKITIPEGLNVNEIADVLESKGVISGKEFIEKATSASLAKQLIGKPLSSLEGYLFPETYFYKKGVIAEELINMMTSRFKIIWDSLKVERDDTSLTDQEIVTLASIIEKETGDPSERNMISEVFHNRLKLGMRLESDPTVMYALGNDFDGDLTREQMKTTSNYNTYSILGLPPGPITNPGRASLEAALNPTDFNYLYFVSKGNGRHEFSTNYRDHLRAVKKYQDRSGTIEKKPW
ncbi:MAG: endolytic transglycosylase MltG [Deltaproteobacteria bacterium]|nr:endolytic transglycosylase MltG [Deltaproteobacteria bacterium]